MLIAGAVLLHLSVAALVIVPLPVTTRRGLEAPLLQVSLVSGQADLQEPLQHAVAGSVSPQQRSTPAISDVSLPADVATDSAAADPGTDPVYLPSVMMERRPTPVSAPDLQRIGVKPVSGLPIRLRIYVAPSGQVSRVEQLDVSELDTEFALSVATMFQETLFLPGRLDGVDRYSYLDVELLAE